MHGTWEATHRVDASCQRRTLWGFKWRSDTTGVHFRTFVDVTWGRRGNGEGHLGLHSEFSVNLGYRVQALSQNKEMNKG